MSPAVSAVSPSADRKAKPSRWKSAAKRVGLLAGTLLVLAAGAEIATRVLTDTAPLMVRDPVLGSRYIRSFQGKVYVPEVGRKVALRFNQVGFRGPDRPLAKPSGVRRVAVLGDSFIAAVSVEEEKTAVGQLERMLNQSHPQFKWEVLNFGVSGAGTGQELLLYQQLVRRFEPDIVLCAFFVGNDLADNCNRLSSQPRVYYDLDEEGRLYQVPFSPNRQRLSAWLNEHSRFYVWQKGLFRRAANNLRGKAGRIAHGDLVYCREESADLSHAWRLSRKLIAALRREVESHGSLFALVLLPSARQVYDDCFQQLQAQAGEAADCFDREYPEQRLGAMCDEAGTAWLSIVGDFRAAAPRASMAVEEEWLYNGGDGHFNERGNEIAARAMHHFLTQGGPQLVAGQPLLRRLK